MEHYDYKILKFLYKRGEVPSAVLLKRFQSSKYQITKRLDDLCHYRHRDGSTCIYYDDGVFRISEFGRVVFQNAKVDRFRKRIRDTIVVIVPTVIAILSFLKSYGIEITSIWQSIARFLRLGS